MGNGRKETTGEERGTARENDREATLRLSGGDIDGRPDQSYDTSVDTRGPPE